MRRPNTVFLLALLASVEPLPCKHNGDIETRTTSFGGCISSMECNREAHDGVAEHQRCMECGAFRIVNLNDGKIERGPWVSLRARS